MPLGPRRWRPSGDSHQGDRSVPPGKPSSRQCRGQGHDHEQERSADGWIDQAAAQKPRQVVSKTQRTGPGSRLPHKPTGAALGRQLVEQVTFVVLAGERTGRRRRCRNVEHHRLRLQHLRNARGRLRGVGVTTLRRGEPRVTHDGRPTCRNSRRFYVAAFGRTQRRVTVRSVRGQSADCRQPAPGCGGDADCAGSANERKISHVRDGRTPRHGWHASMPSCGYPTFIHRKTTDAECF